MPRRKIQQDDLKVEKKVDNTEEILNVTISYNDIMNVLSLTNKFVLFVLFMLSLIVSVIKPLVGILGIAMVLVIFKFVYIKNLIKFDKANTNVFAVALGFVILVILGLYPGVASQNKLVDNLVHSYNAKIKFLEKQNTKLTIQNQNLLLQLGQLESDCKNAIAELNKRK